MSIENWWDYQARQTDPRRKARVAALAIEKAAAVPVKPTPHDVVRLQHRPVRQRGKKGR